ncbi:hypothetical protein TNCV_56871 [Trichonephila clavipes]|nr:hypothetical protein TNCV_56871 [Trichonephila clavipes]
MHNALLCETNLAPPKQKIVSILGSEKVLQLSSEELTFEPNSHAIALASTKRGVSWGSEKGLLPIAVIYVNGHQGRLKLRGFQITIASKRLDQLWRRLDRDPKLNNLYTKFIKEYLSLDHMEEISNIDDITSEEGFFLPYITVFLEQGTALVP